MPAPTLEAVRAALSTVNDPEIRRPITELDMVKAVTSTTAASRVDLLLTVPAAR